MDGVLRTAHILNQKFRPGNIVSVYLLWRSKAVSVPQRFYYQCHLFIEFVNR